MNLEMLNKKSKDELIELFVEMDSKEYDTDKLLARIEELQKTVSKSNIDRVGDWDKFSKMMHDYIEKFTVGKYGQSKKFDLMSITEPRVCLWNIIKYSLRCWYDSGKINDLHKIAHYAQMAYTLSDGDLSKAGITNVKGD